jgi:tubulin-specific chaperone A
MAETTLRQIRIKTGVLKRAVREREMYCQEVVRERQRYDNMKETNCESHALGHQEKVIQENEMMIPNCDARVKNAYQDLISVLQDVPEDLLEDTDVKAAQELVSKASSIGS